MLYGTQRNPPRNAPVSVYYITKWHFPQDDWSVDILLYSYLVAYYEMTMKQAFISYLLDYKMKNNMKMSTFSSMESPCD